MTQHFKLNNGIILSDIKNMDGGGSTHYVDFLEIINTRGKEHYTRALEWCAGPGFIGFAILGNKICDHMVFMDKYEPAIDSCNKTAVTNSVSDNVTTYTVDAISKIPSEEKFDLVVGNPPHVWDRDIFITETKKTWTQNGHIDSLTQDDIDKLERLLLDHGQEIHVEFFNNITKYLLPGADLFISEPGNSMQMPEIVKYATDNNLIFMGEQPMPSMQGSAPHATLLHFRNSL